MLLTILILVYQHTVIRGFNDLLDDRAIQDGYRDKIHIVPVRLVEV
ncbi:hypothetical protein Pgy4_24603 [Pseudomonas savastanoi pv. glycinea str. race 4]|uniref:Uncharacterized protein n=1 Tax=Pseudomonas savastanoi pv. glycinea str. race 4 TaxID=875330 RepID=F3CAF9_PSESG|nr:hypothetical protein Pgy4_24603 [Pseudomonas savastanoi pv. glycinea str. race 4]